MPKEANSRRVGIRTGFGRGNSGPIPCFIWELLSLVAVNAGIKAAAAVAAATVPDANTGLLVRLVVDKPSICASKPGFIYGVLPTEI